MTFVGFQKRLFRPAHPIAGFLVGLLVLTGLYEANRWIHDRVLAENQELSSLKKSAEQLAVVHDHYALLRDLKERDVSQFKAGFSGLAKTRKTLFESGLSIHEERRLLEKQLEIMTTYLIINPSLQRIFLMRGEQPLQSYLITYIPLRSFAGAPDTLPPSVRIVSKERFANPKRGESEQVNGQLQYTPPQVGTSLRSNALGEYVIFTNSKLILHGPPVKPEDHEKFPHICLGLDLEAARKLYRTTFIGTKIIVSAPIQLDQK